MSHPSDKRRAQFAALAAAALGIALCGAIWLLPGEAWAKAAGDCEYGTNCEVPDEDGCCPPPKGKVAREFLEKLREGGKNRGAGKHKKSSGDCREGQVSSEGHCCWIGQQWDGSAGVCMGKADSCPEGYEVAGRGCARPVDWVESAPAHLKFMRAEVTVEQYTECLMAGGCHPGYHFSKDDNKYCNFDQKGSGGHPMNCVAYGGAAQYCAWVGGRLPTEAEWEAEATGAGTRIYPWGNEPQPKVGNAVFKTQGTMPVCSKPDGNSISGVCDMSGNVWEWTSSLSEDGDTWMVIRGGSWLSTTAESLTGTYRSGQDPNTAWITTGLRCVR